ncbi:MAG: hypothetical protein GXO35_01735 [Gammaproteobacteria bacterium]|nr:hypothetical protein [Gammaproteobacteria bacterium]
MRAPWPLNWQGFPVPILPQHVVTALIVAWALSKLAAYRRRRLSWGYGLALAAAAWFVWMKIEPAPNYFLPKAYPPHNVRYPASDARVYVLSVQQARLGYGYYAHPSSPRSRYGHPFVGKFGLYTVLFAVPLPSENQITVHFAVWLAFNALLPVLGYLVGRALHSSTTGFAFALLLLARSTVALSVANRLDAVHVKNIMSEPVLRLVFLALLYALLHWPRLPKQGQWLGGALIGALLAWSVLVRLEALLVLFGLLAFAILFLLVRRAGGRALVAAIIALFAVWAPWMTRTWFLTQSLGEDERTPWFFSRRVRAGASVEYRSPPTPTPTPAPTPSSQTHPSSQTLISSHLRSSSPKSISPTKPLLDNDKAETTPWLKQLLTILQHIPILGDLLRWPRDLWLHIWNYIGRNVITTWTMFPWGFRFYDALQVTRMRPFAESRPLTWWHGLVWGVNLALVALGWVAVWRRDRWAALAPWLIYSFYILGISFARTGGGRYIIPIDWIPVLFYVAGWVVLFRIIASILEIPFSSEDISSPLTHVHGWAWLLLTGGLTVASALGVWAEVYSVWRSTRQPDLLPPRHRLTTLDEVFAQLETWNVWSQSPVTKEDLQTMTHTLHIQPDWGFAYFPRYVASGQYCGDWCGYLNPSQPLLFFVIMGTWGQLPIVIPADNIPKIWPSGSEAIALLCPPRKDFHHREALLVAIHTPEGETHVYVNPSQKCDYAFVRRRP